jgi:hypothetical protein
MMTEKTPELILFLLEAKQKTYAGGGEHAPSSRPASFDLPYRRGDYFYLDSYLGGERFVGEEAVWLNGQPLWGMNYYGYLLAPEAPEGFGEFLKRALLAVPVEAPYRGPAFYKEGLFEYRCEWDGAVERFEGRETIWLAQQPIYELLFHGGTIQ